MCMLCTVAVLIFIIIFKGLSKKDLKRIIQQEEEDEKLNMAFENSKDDTVKEKILKRELLVLSIKNLSYLNPNIRFSCDNDIDSIA